MIPILYRYLLREILRYIAIVLTVVVSIYLTVDFFEQFDRFRNAGLPISRMFTFFVFNTPSVIAQIFPVTVLLAILIVFGLMSRHNEIIALKSSGISIYYLFKPVLFIGIFSSVFLFFFADRIVPPTAEKADRIWQEEVRHESVVISKEKNIWLKDNRMIMNIRYYNPKEKAVFGIALNYFDENFRLIRKIDAKKGIFQNGQWLLFDVIEQVLDKSDKKYSVKLHDELIGQLKLIPEDFRRVIKQSQEMNFKELHDYVRKIEEEGYDATIYRTDLHAKIAFPFICIILSLVGTGIAARAKMKEGLPLSIAYGIGIAFLCWIFYSFCLSLGYGEMLPPIAAAWTANAVFLCVGVVLLMNAE